VFISAKTGSSPVVTLFLWAVTTAGILFDSYNICSAIRYGLVYCGRRLCGHSSFIAYSGHETYYTLSVSMSAFTLLFFGLVLGAILANSKKALLRSNFPRLAIFRAISISVSYCAFLWFPLLWFADVLHELSGISPRYLFLLSYIPIVALIFLIVATMSVRLPDPDL
jgi:hypothetical protein